MGTSEGLVFLVRKGADGTFSAGVTGFVAICSAIGLRDDTLNAFIGKLLMAVWWTATHGCAATRTSRL